MKTLLTIIAVVLFIALGFGAYMFWFAFGFLIKMLIFGFGLYISYKVVKIIFYDNRSS